MAKVFRVMVIEKRGYSYDVEARDWADSIRKVQNALDDSRLKKLEEPTYDDVEVNASVEIDREDANEITAL